MAIASHHEVEQFPTEGSIRQRPNGLRVLRQLRELFYLDGRVASSLRKAGEFPLITAMLSGIVLAVTWLVTSSMFGNVGAPTSVPTGPVAAFLDHPYHCLQLLGNDHTSGEVPPPQFHTDLSAALDASVQPTGIFLHRQLPFLEIVLESRPLPAAKAIVDLSRLCKQRLGRA